MNATWPEPHGIEIKREDLGLREVALQGESGPGLSNLPRYSHELDVSYQIVAEILRQLLGNATPASEFSCSYKGPNSMSDLAPIEAPMTKEEIVLVLE
jgi:hypothetical protein